MLGSIFIGLSGMNAFSTGLRQISNNITNINSLGFKASDLTFVNLIGGGGGQGVSLEPPRIDFAQGELRQTGRDLDLAIDGDGFLVLLKDAEHVFARTGSFEVKDNGDIVLSGTDYKLTALDASGAPVALSLGERRTSPPQATTNVKFSENLSTSAVDFKISNINVFNADGVAEVWEATFSRGETAAPGEWTVTVKTAGGASVGTDTLKFLGSIVDPAKTKLHFTSGDRSVDFDFSGDVSSFSTGTLSTLHVATSDGYAAGEMTSLKINDDGALELTYSNEQKVVLGNVAIANFRDPQQLEQQSNGLFTYEGRFGREYFTSKSERVGKVVSGRLEASNVDLSRAFGDLILIQRGYQASSQVISVSNDMIQQLFGIRGQG